MRGAEGAQVLDISAARLRVATVKIGCQLSYVTCGFGAIYLALTWHQPHRPELVALFVTAGLGTFVIASAPVERIVRSRWCEAFFLGWSVLDLGLIVVGMLIDGGTRSPVAVLLFGAAVFAGMSYPLRSVIAVGVLTVVSYVIVAILSGSTSQGTEAWFCFGLAYISAMSAWQAANQNRQHALLARISRADPLTGCLNRRGFEGRVQAELRATARRGTQGALLVLDLDQFKLVNDRHGHAVGDELLCWVGGTIESNLRPLDSVGRLGGDEFAVLLPDVDATEALNCATRIRTALHDRTGASIGVATYPLDGVDVDALLQQADARLYASRPSKRDPGRLAERLSWAEALAHAVDARMGGGNEHSALVASYAAMIARRLGWSDEQLGLLRIAATLHDIGKFAVPESILTKPGALSDGEWAEMRKHPEIGAELVSRIEGLEVIVPWIRHSHERYDGQGYPDRRGGEDILAAARIIFVADAFDAMTAHRPYRPAMSACDALAELRRHSGTQFDPEAVEALHQQLSAATRDAAPVAAPI